ncbi:MAG TPA: hypothetical protein VHV55_02515 [Pirellulales bacterium]|jgi:hypothetical protein|nr:hypothetical protein [Pirellulales bacterium]
MIFKIAPERLESVDAHQTSICKMQPLSFPFNWSPEMATVTKPRRKRRGNKSAMIREYFTANPNAGPTEVVNALAEKKVKVTPTLVSNVKARMQHAANPAAKSAKRGRRGPGRPPRNVSGETSFPMSLLVEAKRLADQAGSLDAARQAIDALSKLQ